ncbi:Restriction endonuclease S subunits-like protein [Burkholderia vietnamiensis G4]|uniref:Restriction endonuclease S subunits-like protein n=2 Tax=Burkholderia vietnamiensis TaxID=60552 RepID=A4JAI7_BURVG|nr:Restriction endonuclease S subunits-like protein [Burkholderia vietnamiensis G4]
MVSLGDVTDPALRLEAPQAGTIYRQIGVRLWGEGAYERESIDGADTKYPNFNRIEADDLVVNKIWARNGSVAVVTTELSGGYVSTEFPAYTLKGERILPAWMRLVTKWRGFWQACDEKAQGTSGKNRIKPGEFLAIEIPLPPLPEQRAIVAKLDELSDKTTQLNAYLDTVEADADALIRSYMFGEQANGYEKRKMSELVSLRSTDVAVDNTQEYRFAGVYSFGRGVFASAVKSGSDFAYERLSTVKAGDFTYPKLMAWEGALGVVPPECDGMVVSPEFPVFTVNTDAVLPEVLDIYFRTPSVWPELAALSGGTNLRRRRLQPSDFLEYEMSVPPMPVQTKLRDLRVSIAALKARHAAIRQSNTALVPATLERIFGEHRAPAVQPSGTTVGFPHPLDVKVKVERPLTIDKMNEIAVAGWAGQLDD